jgi:type II secretory pathway pseudopilin PulG
MRARGFTVIELLIGLAIVMLIGGAIANVVEPARAAFDRVPAELEMEQRGRTAIDAITRALRSAGKSVAATSSLGAFADMVNPVTLAEPVDEGDAFTALTLVAPVVNGAEGVLDANQAFAAAPLTFAVAPCPNVKDVCGFTPGTTAVIADAAGHHDVFVVSSTTPAARRLNADRSFTHAYASGSAVIEIDHYTFRLATQADGSASLIRETTAGAIQPVVDFVRALEFKVQGALVHVAVTIEAPTSVLRRTIAARVFRSSVVLRNAS